MDFKEIKKIAQIMTDHDLSEFIFEDDNSTLQMKRGATVVAAAPQIVSMPAAAPAAVPAGTPASVVAPDAAPAADDGLIEIPSPMVGTFYRAPSPDAPPFVEVGADISETSVVCIIEAMKVMNEIQADVKGRIKKILIDNATPVQFGQPLFLVEPA
ncbi:MAG: acetyl-CoA carboxylase biotin carboxyl carrier protein [Kiritimatiellales bacterium]